MPLTTVDAVEKVLLDNYDFEELPDLYPFIEAASVVVDDVVECATEAGKTLSASRRELIERWLAAHFYAAGPDKTYSRKRTEKAEGWFDGKTEKYLESTLFGQMAVILDSTGCLQEIAVRGRQSIGGYWLGRPPSQQTPYDQRD